MGPASILVVADDRCAAASVDRGLDTPRSFLARLLDQRGRGRVSIRLARSSLGYSTSEGGVGSRYASLVPRSATRPAREGSGLDTPRSFLLGYSTSERGAPIDCSRDRSGRCCRPGAYDAAAPALGGRRPAARRADGAHPA